MGHHPHDMMSGKVGEYFEKDGYTAYEYQEMEDVAPDHACFPDWQLVKTTKKTKTSWLEYLETGVVEH